MKKFLVVAGLLLASVPGFSQMNKGEWSLIPKVGVNIATMTNSDDADCRIGLAIGAETEYALESNASLKFGAQYSQQGIKQDLGDADMTIQMDYLNVPVMLNYYFSPKFAVNVGLQPGILVNDEAKVSAYGQSVSVGIKDALGNVYSRGVSVPDFVLGLPVGVSCVFGKVVLDARYVVGLTNACSVPGESSKHNVGQITIGYKFGL